MQKSLKIFGTSFSGFYDLFNRVLGMKCASEVLVFVFFCHGEINSQFGTFRPRGCMRALGGACRISSHQQHHHPHWDFSSSVAVGALHRAVPGLPFGTAPGSGRRATDLDLLGGYILGLLVASTGFCVVQRAAGRQ